MSRVRILISVFVGISSVLIYKYLFEPRVNPPTNTYSLVLQPNQVKEDLHYLIVTLQEAHPNLFKVNTLESLEKEIQNIQDKTENNFTYLQFLGELAHFFNKIGCVYTEWGHSSEYINHRNENVPVFPLQLSIVGDRFYVKTNLSLDSSIHSGDEILSFNDETPSEYLAKNYPLLPVDGHVRTIQKRWLEAYFPNHHSNFWGQPEVFEMVLLDKNGTKKNISLRALLKKDFVIPDNTVSEIRRPLEYSLYKNIGILTINTLIQQKIEEKGQNLEYFMDSILVGNLHHPEALIINIRGPGWGSIELSRELYASFIQDEQTFMQKIKCSPDSVYTYSNLTEQVEYPTIDSSLMAVSGNPNAYIGPVYLLIDGWNVHAKAVFCQKMKNRPRTYFAGEEAGATLYGIRDRHIKMQLPHSGIEVYIPTVEYIMDSTNYYSLRGIDPKYSFADISQDQWVEKLKTLVQHHLESK